MDFRKAVNGNPAVIGGGVVVAIVVAGWVLWTQLLGSTGPGMPNSYYFSSDDGQTWFAAARTNVPPFESDGKQAYRAHVMQCGNEPPFVAYLERYTPASKTIVEKYNADVAAGIGNLTPTGPNPNFLAMTHMDPNSIQVKKPGDKEWVGRMSAGPGVGVKCKGGDPSVEVTP